MLLGELLVACGLVTRSHVQLALASQEKYGGRIGENLIALGLITKEALESALQAQYEMVQAILTNEDLLSKALRVLGDAHPLTNRRRCTLAAALIAVGRYAEALKLAKTAYAGHRATLGRDHAWTHESIKVFVQARAAAASTGQAEEAEDEAAPADPRTKSSPRQRPAVATRVGTGEQHASVVATNDLDAARPLEVAN